MMKKIHLFDFLWSTQRIIYTIKNVIFFFFWRWAKVVWGWVNDDSAFSSGVWTFLWFVCFCLLANQWSHTTQSAVPADAARAVVAFSFFSTATWVSTSHFLFLPDSLLVYLINWNKYHAFFLKVLLTMFALQRYRQGIDEVGLGYNDPTSDHTSPYPAAYTGAPEGYQQSPFAASPAGQGGYQPPAYWGWRHFNASERLTCVDCFIRSTFSFSIRV